MASGSSLLILPRGKDHAAPLFHPLTSRTCAPFREFQSVPAVSEPPCEYRSEGTTPTHLVPPFVDQDGAADGHSFFVLHERSPYPGMLGYEVVQEGARFEHEEREGLEVVGREGGRVRGVGANKVFVVPVPARAVAVVMTCQFNGSGVVIAGHGCVQGVVSRQ